jgi:hypothetical protein
MKNRIRIVQKFLQQKGLYNGTVDGIAGPVTMAGLARVEGLNPLWPKTRQLTGFIQIVAREHEIDAGPVDGLWGPQTEAAFNQLVYLEKHGSLQPSWRPDEIIIQNPNQWPLQHSREFQEYFGERCTRQTTIELPYDMKLSWRLSTRVRQTNCHENIAGSLVRVLQKVKDIYGNTEISRLRLDHFGGCYNDRKVRNGTLWSMHAWGIALDFDPDHNKLNWGRDRAAFSHPDYDEWWKCWEEEGWISLGRKRNFDWMHIQAARLPE